MQDDRSTPLLGSLRQDPALLHVVHVLVVHEQCANVGGATHLRRSPPDLGHPSKDGLRLHRVGPLREVDVRVIHRERQLERSVLGLQLIRGLDDSRRVAPARDELVAWMIGFRMLATGGGEQDGKAGEQGGNQADTRLSNRRGQGSYVKRVVAPSHGHERRTARRD